MTINPAVYSKLSYDPLRDLRVLGSICEVPMVLVANTQMPVNTLSEFIAWAKTKPGEVFGASSGNGAFSHLLLELFKSKTGLALAHIPFKGEAPAVQHVISNQDAIVLFSTPSPVLGPAMSNKLKVLGVSTRQRMNQLPNVPSLSEQGLSDINESFWYGLAVSASTPNPIAESLSQSVWESAKSPPLIQALDKVGCASQALTANEFQERIKQDHAKYTNIAKSVGMRVD
jgi:tripartite-type tricarboxylate transporter receptor subunit TctC